MEREKKALVEKKGQLLPLGTVCQNQSVNFSIQIAGHQKCTIHLYKKGNDKKAYSFPMYRDTVQEDIFTLFLENFQYEDYVYTYEIEEGEFVDPYAKVVRCRNDFGLETVGEEKVISKAENLERNLKLNTHLRGGFLTEYPPFHEDQLPNLPYSELIMYKLHVRGFTKADSSLAEHKGTYEGLKDMIPYLKKLGINAVLLMPITEFNELIQNEISHEKKVNYWGFEAPSFFFAPKVSYSMDKVRPDVELKKMMQEFHKNQIEILLEMNFTSDCNPSFILSCVRHWRMEYHIDGFHIQGHEWVRNMLAADPFLSSAKLLGEDWNVAHIRQWSGMDHILNQKESKEERRRNPYNPYDTFGQEQQFENLAEYNDGFLVDARRFLKSDEDQVQPYIMRTKRNPMDKAVINYITNHDGFTLHDLYTYDQKHNENNGENNKDGSVYNYSWNCGVEGETKRKKINELRNQLIRNAFTALILSQGVPMLLAGDEFGNSKDGNNNSYCQDNSISWINWEDLDKNKDLFLFVKNLIDLRKKYKILHMENELRGMDYIYCGMPDISFHGVKAWILNDSHYSRELGVLLCGKYVNEKKQGTNPTFYIIYNMFWEPHVFDLPMLPSGESWFQLYDTSKEIQMGEDGFYKELLEDQRQIKIAPRSIAVFIGQLAKP